MKRLIPAAILLVFCLRAAAEDGIVYYLHPDTRKEVDFKGKIKAETPAGVTVTIGKDDKVIPPYDVIQIAYTTASTAVGDYRTPFSNLDKAMKVDGRTDRGAKERKALLDKALSGFSDVAPKIGDSPNALRYVKFRIAEVQCQMAQDDAALKPKAVKALEDFCTAYPNGWETVLALELLARTYEQDRLVDEARKALEKLADLPGVPADVKRKSETSVAQMLMRAKRPADAEKRLTSLLQSMTPSDPQRPFVQVYQIQCKLAQKTAAGAETQLAEAIRSSGDANLRAVAYNTLGDVYLADNKKEDAFWQYLRVDVMYGNVDVNEHAKALYNLAKLHDEVKKDTARARNCKERLMDPRFRETEYQKLAEKLP
jgi:tetratricopeptide (TPR) repeat protein